jgi:hypothetical protein
MIQFLVAESEVILCDGGCEKTQKLKTARKNDTSTYLKGKNVTNCFLRFSKLKKLVKMKYTFVFFCFERFFFQQTREKHGLPTRHPISFGKGHRKLCSCQSHVLHCCLLDKEFCHRW